MPRIPSLTSLRDGGLVLTAAAVTFLAVEELLAGRRPTSPPAAPPLAAPRGWLHRVDELGGRIRPATAEDVAAARAAAAVDGGDGVFGRGYAGGEPLLPGDPGYSAAGVTHYRVVPTPAADPTALSDWLPGLVRAEVAHLRRAADQLRRTAPRVRLAVGDDWLAGGSDHDDRMHVWSVPDTDPDYDTEPRTILTVSATTTGTTADTGSGTEAGTALDVDEALALAEHVAGFPPAAAAAIAAMFDSEADALQRRGDRSAEGSTARALAIADACLHGSALDGPALQQPAGSPAGTRA